MDFLALHLLRSELALCVRLACAVTGKMIPLHENIICYLGPKKKITSENQDFEDYKTQRCEMRHSFQYIWGHSFTSEFQESVG